MAEEPPERSAICSICQNNFEIPATNGTTIIAHNPVCHDCIKQLFEHSIAAEHNFPPKWGRQVLDPEVFRRILGDNFMRRFEDRRVEFDAPAGQRAYCHGRNNHAGSSSGAEPSETCGGFVGRISEVFQTFARCKKCGAHTCLRCQETFTEDALQRPEASKWSEENHAMTPAIHHHHTCEPSVESKLRSRAFDGLGKGKDYQDCPRCRRRIQLSDGCNHIVCVCGESYCYICARHVSEVSNHWDRSRRACPRYGQPGERTAMYTDHIGGSDEEDYNRRWLVDTGSDSDSDDSYEPPSSEGSAAPALRRMARQMARVYQHTERQTRSRSPHTPPRMQGSEDRARWRVQHVLVTRARLEQDRWDQERINAARRRQHVVHLANEGNRAGPSSYRVYVDDNHGQHEFIVDGIDRWEDMRGVEPTAGYIDPIGLAEALEDGPLNLERGGSSHYAYDTGFELRQAQGRRAAPNRNSFRQNRGTSPIRNVRFEGSRSPSASTHRRETERQVRDHQPENLAHDWDYYVQRSRQLEDIRRRDGIVPRNRREPPAAPRQATNVSNIDGIIETGNGSRRGRSRPLRLSPERVRRSEYQEPLNVTRPRRQRTFTQRVRGLVRGIGYAVIDGLQASGEGVMEQGRVDGSPRRG